MHELEQFKLRFGSYGTPQFRYGDIVMDEVRGEVTIVGLSDGRIPWPIGKRVRGQKTLVVYGDLAKAIRLEANSAVCHWWGITPQTVTKWRKALNVNRVTAGTSALLREHFTPQRQNVMRVKRQPKYKDPARNAKIRQSRLGKPRPKHVHAALLRANQGKHWTEETRQLQMERRRRRFPRTYDPWTQEEDELIKTRTIREVAELTGRTRGTVERRRVELGIRKHRKTFSAEMKPQRGGR